jgi:ricin-type beta-trefoil lectin protein/endosialidase-like protein
MIENLREGLMRNIRSTWLSNRRQMLARLTAGLLGFASALALSLPAGAQGGGKFLADQCRDALRLNPMTDYNNGECQLWKLSPPGPEGWSRLQLKHSGKFLDAKNCTDELNMNPGSNYDGGSCQLWKLVPVSDGWSRIQIKRNGKVLQAQTCGDDVQLGETSDANGGAFQLWRLIPAENSGGWSRLQIKCVGASAPVGGGGAPVVGGGAPVGGGEEYGWNGDTYGWYDDGWDGPGWYIVGYEFRNGFGFGGREGWHNWHHHGSHAHGGHHGDHRGHQGGGGHHAAGGGGSHRGGGGGGGGGHHVAHRGGGGHHGGGHGGHVHRGGGGGGHHGGGHRGGGGGHRGGGGGHRGGGGGHHGGGRHSDIRLKHDIVLLGRLDNGLGFYRFSYNGSDKAYVGVMAQEVQAVKPEAVVRGRDGYLRVYYDELGLRMQTWDEWVAGGRKIPASAPRL